ncbi:hypothetical protein [Agromyces sp. H66]|uniref:hypothetical protein n=1 Tax=Agromyces sp. H66 TaxID=2529859 RepID=UPI0010AA3550|nr:hypothetical protein [Agromyces sp. H66]
MCTAETIVFDGSDKPVGLAPGVVDGVEYTGPSTVFNVPGKSFWVETIVDKDGKVTGVDAGVLVAGGAGVLALAAGAMLLTKRRRLAEQGE